MRNIVIAMVLPGLLLADFRYEQTTRMTKGMMTKLPFGKKPEPTTTLHYYKGGRMATVSGDHKTIIDFDKQLFTTINLKERQYTQMTFEEMRQRMAEVQDQVKDVGKDKNAEIQIKFDAKATGVEKEVGGFPAKEVIFTVEMGVSDGKNSGTMMQMKNTSWHSEAVTGYKEYLAFFERMKDKGSWLNLGQVQGQMGGQKGMAEGMAKMAEEMRKTPGIPVLTISRMTMPGMQMPDMSGMNTGGQQNGGNGQGGGQSAGQSIGDAAKRAGGEAAGGATGRAIGGPIGGMLGGALGGRMGGFGGLGKKKKDDAAAQAEADAKAKADVDAAQQQVQAVAQAAKEAAAASKSADGMLMMESVSDASGFSTAPIGNEVFEVPAGFSKMDPEFGKKRKK